MTRRDAEPGRRKSDAITRRDVEHTIATYARRLQAAAWLEGYGQGLRDMAVNADVTINPYRDTDDPEAQRHPHNPQIEPSSGSDL